MIIEREALATIDFHSGALLVDELYQGRVQLFVFTIT